MGKWINIFKLAIYRFQPMTFVLCFTRESFVYTVCVYQFSNSNCLLPFDNSKEIKSSALPFDSQNLHKDNILYAIVHRFTLINNVCLFVFVDLPTSRNSAGTPLGY